MQERIIAARQLQKNETRVLLIRIAGRTHFSAHNNVLKPSSVVQCVDPDTVSRCHQGSQEVHLKRDVSSTSLNYGRALFAIASGFRWYYLFDKK